MKPLKKKQNSPGLKIFVNGVPLVKLKAGYFINSISLLLISAILFSCVERPGNTLEKTILNKNWKGIFMECQTSDSTLKDPVIKAIVAHTSIMLNKNNISFVLLNYINGDSTSRRLWQAWTTDFVTRFPKEAIAHYFHGDAMMRNGDKSEALRSFEKSVSLDPDFALAYNARGLVFSLETDKSRSCQDFNKAIELNPDVAEFYASRATMFYNGKAPEAALKDYSKAVELSPDFALSINGKACSRFYSISNGESSVTSLDSISSGLYCALQKLNLSLIQANIRSIILEFENNFFPDQVETPRFKISDFLDWQRLRSLSVNNTSDVLRNLLKKPLPEKIDIAFLNEINSLLVKRSLFQPLLQNKNISDSIGAIISVESRAYKSNDKKSSEQTAVINRLIFEKIYPGLIASFKERIPGMHITSKSFSAENIGDFAHGIRQGVKDIPSFGKLGDMHPAVNATKAIAYGAASIVEAASLTKQIYNANHELNKINHDPIYQGQLEKFKTTNPDLYNRLKPDPGGALADVKRKMIFDEKPYSLICAYSLGYENK